MERPLCGHFARHCTIHHTVDYHKYGPPNREYAVISKMMVPTVRSVPYHAQARLQRITRCVCQCLLANVLVPTLFVYLTHHSAWVMKWMVKGRA
jgi:hypothetical protein